MMMTSLLVMTFSAGCLSFKDNTGDVYEGAAMGYRGMIRARVGFDQGTITDITVTESQEDRNIGGAAIEELIDLVLMYNTTEIDVVSGATETSLGFLAAVENAIMGHE